MTESKTKRSKTKGNQKLTKTKNKSAKTSRIALTKKRSNQNISEKLFQNNKYHQFLDIFFESPILDTLVKNFKDNLKLFYQKKKFQKYYLDYKPFSDIGGKSGAVIGTFKNNNNYVMKLYFSKETIKPSSLVKRNNCLQVDFRVNELLVNLLMSNLKLLPNFTSQDLKIISPHLLPLVDGGIEENYIYLISPKIGINHQIEGRKVFMTNLREVLLYNHLKCLKRWIDEGNQEMIDLYDQFMSYQFGKYLKAVKILEEKISLLTTDMKMTNIFIKKRLQRSSKWSKLRDDGCLIDFILLITDLDKARYKINNYHVLPIDHKPYKNKIASQMGLKLTLAMRYNCKDKKFKEICPPITYNDFEILFMLVDLYVIYNQSGYSLRDFSHLKTTLLEYLNMSRTEFNQILKIVKKKNYSYDKNFTYYINKIILEFCQILKKTL